MKHLTITDKDGNEVLDVLVPVRGSDFQFEFIYPIRVHLKTLSLKDTRKTEGTRK